MATRFVPDDQAAALSAWAVNHSEWDSRLERERQFWLSRNLAGTPWGVARGTAISAAATAVGVTLTGTSPWTREQQFWAGWADKPPTPVA